MEKKNLLRHFSMTLLVNIFFCTIIVLTIYRFDIPGYTLALPIIFLLLTAIQQDVTTPQHALFIALMIVLIPLLSFLLAQHKTIIFALFYLFTVTSIDAAIHLKRPLPFPDVIPFVFMFAARLFGVNEKIIFGLVVAYYLARITTLYLAIARDIYGKEDLDD